MGYGADIMTPAGRNLRSVALKNAAIVPADSMVP